VHADADADLLHGRDEGAAVAAGGQHGWNMCQLEFSKSATRQFAAEAVEALEVAPRQRAARALNSCDGA
jgi:hypothetical protein